MHFPTFLAFVAATAVAAGRNGNSSEPFTERQRCRQIERLTHLIELAGNQTLLADETGSNATKIAEIRAKASEAAAELPVLQSNTTLVIVCAAAAANDAAADDCRRVSRLEKQARLAADDAWLAEKFGGNQTEIDAFEAKVREDAPALAALQANSTLAGICAADETADDCKRIAKLKKKIDHASNDTWLAQKFDGNQTEIDEYKAKADESRAKLTEMQANMTLASICAALNGDTAVNKTNDGGARITDGSRSQPGIAAINGASAVFTVLVAGLLSAVFAL